MSFFLLEITYKDFRSCKASNEVDQKFSYLDHTTFVKTEKPVILTH